MRENFYSSIFDSSPHLHPQSETIEINIAKMILTLKRPVLALPQMYDSEAILNLASNPYFISILKKGFLTTSLFGSHESLLDYVINRFQPERSIIPTVLPFFWDGEIDQKVVKETQEILYCKFLYAKDKNISSEKKNHPWDRDISEIMGERLEWFESGVIKLDEALNIQSKTELCPQNLPNPVRMSMFAEHNKNLLTQNLSDLKEQDKIIINFYGKLVEEAAETTSRGDDRVDYYNIIIDWSRKNIINKNIENHLKSLVDLCYNESMATRISKKREIDNETKNEYAQLIIDRKQLISDIEDITNNDDFKFLFEKKIYRNVDSFIGNRYLDWDKINEITNIFQKESPRNPEVAINLLYKEYRDCDWDIDITKECMRYLKMKTLNNKFVELNEGSSMAKKSDKTIKISKVIQR